MYKYSLNAYWKKQAKTNSWNAYEKFRIKYGWDKAGIGYYLTCCNVNYEFYSKTRLEHIPIRGILVRTSYTFLKEEIV